MQLSSLLHAENCAAKTKAKSKKRALELVAKLAAETISDVKAEELFQQLVARERLGSTGIGLGIALPHCRYEAIENPTGICMTLANPIDFDSIDNKAVDVIFAILVPQEANESHLQALAAVAEVLQQKELLENIRRANSAQEILQAITN